MNKRKFGTLTCVSKSWPTQFDEIWLLANSRAQTPRLKATLTCPLKRVNFTGDLPAEDNNADQRRKAREGGGPLTKRTNEVGGRAEGFVCRSAGDEESEDKEMLNTPRSLFSLIVPRLGEDLPLAAVTLFQCLAQ